MIGGLTRVAEPDPALRFNLLKVWAAVRGKYERDEKLLFAVRPRVTYRLNPTIELNPRA